MPAVSVSTKFPFKIEEMQVVYAFQSIKKKAMKRMIKESPWRFVFGTTINFCKSDNFSLAILALFFVNVSYVCMLHLVV